MTPLEILEHEGHHSLEAYTLTDKELFDFGITEKKGFGANMSEFNAVEKESDMARRNGCPNCPRKTYSEGVPVKTNGVNSREINVKKTKQWREIRLKQNPPTE